MERGFFFAWTNIYVLWQSLHERVITSLNCQTIQCQVVPLSVSSAAFILCWSPYFLFDILDNFNILPETKERFYASVIIQNLPALNSAVNPLIYCFFSNSLCPPSEYCSFTLTLTAPKKGGSTKTRSLNWLTIFDSFNSDHSLFFVGKEELRGWQGLSGKGAMEGKRCRSCQNQNTSSTDNVLQSHTGTCTEENRGSPPALCTVKWMDTDWQEPVLLCTL